MQSPPVQLLLRQVATAALSPAEIAVPIGAVLEAGRRPHLDVLLYEADGIDLERRCAQRAAVTAGCTIS